ncbi:MAG: hypothetical protein WC536_00130 [Patescibacteria group bacterium]
MSSNVRSDTSQHRGRWFRSSLDKQKKTPKLRMKKKHRQGGLWTNA